MKDYNENRVDKDMLNKSNEDFKDDVMKSTNTKEISGIIYGNVSSSSTIYGYDKFSTPRGHGFAAENANHINDKIKNLDIFGNKVKLVSEEIDPETGRIIKNGADRVVNGISIQTKYCESGSKCIKECFDKNTQQFKYFNQDGSPMKIEVPFDKYDDAVKAMENKIKSGQVSGVTDPNEAKDIVVKGSYTYKQAKNIAKAGNIDSIIFDVETGLITSSVSLGISTLITFSTSIWRGEDFDKALKDASYAGLNTFGISFFTSVFASQLSRSGVNSVVFTNSEKIVKLIGPKGAAVIVNAFRNGTNIYGAAAMKSLSKMLSNNIITGGISIAVMSIGDVARIFSGRISGAQLLKNVVNITSSVAGGTAGWVGGAAAGAAVGSIIPIIGTSIGGTIGGILGAFAGGSVGQTISSAATNIFIEDDANEMLRIIEEVFQVLATDYLVGEEEATKIVDRLKEKIDASLLRTMYASNDRKKFANDLLIDYFEDTINNRKKIITPTKFEFQNAVKEVLEEIANEEEK